MASAEDGRTEIAVVGGGPVGLIAALAIARTGAETTLLAPPAPDRDHRTTALLGGSVDGLASIGVWQAIAPAAAPLRKLRIVDGTRRLIRSPEVLFDARELDLDAFGYNVENEILLAALRAAAQKQSNLHILSSAAAELTIGETGAVIILTDGSRWHAKLVVGADGRNSICRTAAGIHITKRELPQHAVALSFSHTRPHNDISTEFHTETGPFTLVPLAGLRSSLVWVCRPRDAARIREADDTELSREIERKSASILGEVRVDSAKGVFPLSVALAEQFALRRVALVGEAGHVIPPIGAQGLNLGIRDAMSISRIVGDARESGADAGGETVLAGFDAERRTDIRTRALAVEALGRSLLSGFLPAHLARGLGLEIAARVPILRRALMRGGLGERYSA